MIPEIVVAVFTNYPEPQYEKRCRELGADYFFHKSKDFLKLADVIIHEGNNLTDEKCVNV